MGIFVPTYLFFLIKNFVDIPSHLKGKEKKEFIIERAKKEFKKFLSELWN